MAELKVPKQEGHPVSERRLDPPGNAKGDKSHRMFSILIEAIIQCEWRCTDNLLNTLGLQEAREAS